MKMRIHLMKSFSSRYAGCPKGSVATPHIIVEDQSCCVADAIPRENMKLDQLLCEKGISCYDKDLEMKNSSTLLLLIFLYFMNSMYINFGHSNVGKARD